MPFGPNFGFGVQRLIDAQQRYSRATTPVYLRLRDFAPVQGTQWAGLGFRIAPSGLPVGITDVCIDPPPSMVTMSLHNIGQSGGKLRFGAKQFLISATFVDAQKCSLGLTDPKLVFSGPLTVGLVNEKMLYSIEDIQHEAVAGRIVTWLLICNANEIR